MFGIIINCFLGQKRIKSPSGNLGEMLVMMVACQVVQQEMDVEVVLVSRREIICTSQVSTTTRNVKQEFPQISSPLYSQNPSR